MSILRKQLRLYLVTDTELCRDLGLVKTVEQAVAAGVTMVQLRAKDVSTAQRVEMALALKDSLAGTGVPLVVNDDVYAAIKADVDGAHIGQGDMPPAEARGLLGRDKILGLSCETPETVKAADTAVLDYLGLGPVFGTATKANHETPIGIDGLADLVQRTALPTVAIGGLKSEHQSDVLVSGADGLAVVSAICGQPDVTQATLKFNQIKGLL